MKQPQLTAYLAIFALMLHDICATSEENCDKLGVLLYEDLACEPRTHDASGCPSSYDCKNLTVAHKCVVQGKIYGHGDAIEGNTIGYSCQFGCSCSEQSSSMHVSCAQGGCIEWSGISPPPGCYRTYKLDSCCSVGEICPADPASVFKCKVDGKEYREGEIFNPKDSCHVCVCQKGFKGKFIAPFCTRYGCDVQVRYQQKIQDGCAPLYIKRAGEENKRCCPISWTCPEGNEQIISSEIKSDKSCKFGKKTLNVGDSFLKEIRYNHRPLKIKCECRIPPLISCEAA